MAFYPKISDDTVMSLELVMRSIDKDERFLDHPDCPYSDQLKALLRRISGVGELDLFADGEEIDNIDDLIKKALNDLEKMGAALSDPTDRLNYLKTKTSLLEKLIGMRERVYNLKDMQEFRSVIMQGLDQMCTKDQITEFMKRLDGVLGIGDKE